MISNFKGIILIISLGIFFTGCGQSDNAVSAEKWSSSAYWKIATVEDVKNGIKAGRDPNKLFTNGQSPLSMAALLNSSPEVINALIEAGAEVNSARLRVPPLVAAASNNSNPEIVKALLKNGANVNIKGINGVSPILMAAQTCSNPEVFKILVEAGADLNDRLDDGTSIADLAMKNFKAGEEIRAILKEKGKKSSGYSKKAQQDFIVLCRTGSIKYFEEMLKSGIPVNQPLDNGLTALQEVMDQTVPNIGKIQLLFKYGASPQKKGLKGEFPLIIFFQKFYYQNLNSNLKKLYNINLDYNKYDSKYTKNDAIKELAKRLPQVYKSYKFTGRELNSKLARSYLGNWIGYSVERALEMLVLFKKNNADLKIHDSHGNNLLHYAVLAQADQKIVDFLKNNQVDFHKKNDFGNTPEEVFELLEKTLSLKDQPSD
jgi:ankyrin repeat protein